MEPRECLVCGAVAGHEPNCGDEARARLGQVRALAAVGSTFLLTRGVMRIVNPPRPEPRQRNEVSRPDVIDLLNQGEVWYPKMGPPVRIEEMTDTHRLNTAALLMRHARSLEFKYSLASFGSGAPDEVLCEEEARMAERSEDPQKWLLGTPLLKALTAVGGTARKRMKKTLKQAKQTKQAEKGQGPFVVEFLSFGSDGESSYWDEYWRYGCREDAEKALERCQERSSTKWRIKKAKKKEQK